MSNPLIDIDNWVALVGLTVSTLRLCLTGPGEAVAIVLIDGLINPHDELICVEAKSIASVFENFMLFFSLLSLFSLCMKTTIATLAACCACVNGFVSNGATNLRTNARPNLGLSAAARPSTSSRDVTMSVGSKIRIGILGASGYTGAELVRLLLCHPDAEIKVLTGNTQAGQSFYSVFPQFSYAKGLPALTLHEAEDWKDVDCVFCCLPHATTQDIIKALPTHLKVIDLSADFRLKDVKSYAEWYGGEHRAPELQKEAVYGLVELNREAIKKARLIANPGCYPTAAQIPLVPLLKAGVILAEDIIIDAKSGTTGAGRAPKQGALYCEVADGIHAYSVAAHRHAPEIEQGLSEVSDTPVILNFTPHLMPMSRGILETIYVKLAPGQTVETAKKTLEKVYENEHFVTVLPGKELPQTRHVRGSNHLFVNVVADRLPGRAIIVSAIDNLVKGASGQAVQNMNVAFGLPEATGIDQAPMFP